MTATSWPIRARPSASDAPTRPHPITTTRTWRSFRPAAECAEPAHSERYSQTRVWAYSWLSCPSFRPPRGGWSSAGRSAATSSRHTLLPKRIALPVFASDALSSVAYAPEEIFLVLSVAGLAAYSMAPWIGLAVAAVMLDRDRQLPAERARLSRRAAATTRWSTTNLGPTAGLTVASALLVDYVLTVAVSMASAMSNIGSAVPFIDDAQGVVRRPRDPAPGVGEPAGHPRVGHRVRHPDLRLHDRHVHHARLGLLPDLRARHPAAGRVGAVRVHSEHGDILGSRWCSWWRGRSRPAARR